MTLNDLTKKALMINPGFTMHSTLSGKEKTIEREQHKVLRERNGFSIKNGVICFVVEREVFVTPFTHEAVKTLIEAGLREKCFYVPLANWEIPKYKKKEWENLKKAVLNH